MFNILTLALTCSSPSPPLPIVSCSLSASCSSSCYPPPFFSSPFISFPLLHFFPAYSSDFPHRCPHLFPFSSLSLFLFLSQCVLQLPHSLPLMHQRLPFPFITYSSHSPPFSFLLSSASVYSPIFPTLRPPFTTPSSLFLSPLPHEEN